MKFPAVFLLAIFFVCGEFFAEEFSEGRMKFEKLDEKEILIESSFFVSEIDDETFARMKGKSFRENCTVPRDELRLVRVLHKNLSGKICSGEIVCNKKIAWTLTEIFAELFKADYPVEKIHLVDDYDGDDEKSMADNNSSCFNFRFISHTKKISNHARGMAIDINPLYNPYCKTVDGKPSVEPANAAEFTDRTKNFPYKIQHGDLCWKIFTSRGFEWGGDWENVKDWQHFEMNAD
jgi:hypothetical protein